MSQKKTIKHDLTMYNPWIMTKDQLIMHIHQILNIYNLEACGLFQGRGDVKQHVTFRPMGYMDGHTYDVDYIDQRLVKTWDFDSMSVTRIPVFEKVEDEELYGYMEELLHLAATFDDEIFTGIGGEICYSFTRNSISWEVQKYVVKEDEKSSFFYKV